MTTFQGKYEAQLEPLRGTTFEAALAQMDPEERVRAQRLRDGLKLRDDDALWIYCGLIKGMEGILHETLSECVTAVEETIRTHLEEQLGKDRSSALSNQPSNDTAPGAGNGQQTPDWSGLVLLGSLFCASTILIGSASVTLGVLAHDGQVPWVPRSPGTGAFSYAMTALLNAPVGGFFAVVGLLGFGMLLAIFRYLNPPLR
jgi:hypothetical protein